MTFNLHVSAFTFTCAAHRARFQRLLNDLHKALLLDDHLRASFYPIWKGEALHFFHQATTADKQAFLEKFDNFLKNHPPTVSLVDIQSYGCTRRPNPGEHPKLCINNQLAKHTAEGLSTNPCPPNTNLLVLTTISTINHELAHAFGAYCWPGDSPVDLAINGRTDTVQEHDPQGNTVQNGRPKHKIIGEGGYVQEAHFFGRSGRLCIIVNEPWDNDWKEVLGLLLDTGNGDFEISREEAMAACDRLQDCQSTTITLEEDTYCFAQNTTRRRVAETAVIGPHSFPPSPPPSGSLSPPPSESAPPARRLKVLGLFGPYTEEIVRNARDAPPWYGADRR